jgi:hypothetical protein
VIEPETREKCFLSVVRDWFKKDGAAAAAWLDESSLDEAMRDSLRTWAAERIHRRPPGSKKGRAPSGSP